MKNFINYLVNTTGCKFVTLDAFDAPIPPVPPRPFVIGCIISIPYDLLVGWEEFNNSHIPFMPVEVTFPDGEVGCDKLFLGTLTKVVTITKGERVRAQGTAVDFIRSFSNWRTALEGLRGKSLVVTADRVVEIAVPGPEGLTRNTHVYNFDFAK